MTTIEVLYAAWALVDTPEKWWRSKEMAGSHCVVSALATSCVAVNELYMECRQALCIAAGLGSKYGDLPGWNDHPSRTHADIMALFARAIRAEEAKVSVRDGMGDVAGLGVGTGSKE